MEGETPSTAPGDARRARLTAFRHNTATDTHILDYFAAAYRHRYLAASVFSVVILIALVQVYTTTPLYRAQSRIIVEVEDDQVSNLTGVLSGENYRDPGPYYQTQFRILTGRELARRTVRRLGLGKVPEFNGAGATPTQLAQNARRPQEPGRSRLGTSGRRRPLPEAILVANFLSRVSVEPVKNSRLVDVAFVSASPEFAARAANQLAREYVAQNAELRRDNVTSGWRGSSRSSIARRARSRRPSAPWPATARSRTRSRSRIARTSSSRGSTSSTTPSPKRRRSLVQKESLYNQIKALGPGASPDTIPAILQNPYIQSIKTRVAELQRERANLSERYGDSIRRS